MLSEAQIALGLAPYGVTADGRMCERIQHYISLLLFWNQKISLTTVVRPEQILQFHFGESLYAVTKVPIVNGRLADVGSGAGFPGIPVAMAVPELKVMLIEANQKKAAFLSEVIRKLELPNVAVLRARMSDVGEENRGLDFVAARAMPHEELIRWSARFLASAGKLVLWLGENDAGLIRRVEGWDWQSPVRIPGSQKRVLLIGLLKTAHE